MRFNLTIIFLLLLGVCQGQNSRKPLEASIGLGIYSNFMTPKYNAADLQRFTGIDVSEQMFDKVFWSIHPALIRDYHVGGAILLKQSPDYRNELTFNIDVSGQFQHHYIVTSSSATLVEEQIIDSITSESTYEQILVSVSEFKDLLMVRPSLSWRLHLNRRINIRTDISTSIGLPIKNGFELSTIAGRLQRTAKHGKPVAEERWIPDGNHHTNFVKSDFFVAIGGSLSIGMEYRVFERRAIFLNLSAVMGKQVNGLNTRATSNTYGGGQMKLISRF